MEKKEGTVVKSLLWSFLERIGTQGVGLVISIILARLIAPYEYGVVAAATIFTGLATSFAIGGFGTALVQKKDADELDYSTMFCFNLVFSSFLLGFIWLGSPIFVQFLDDSYDKILLIRVMRSLGVGVFFAGISSYFESILIKALLFKKKFYLTLFSTLVSAAVGIAMAYSGLGVWALVVQNVLSYFVRFVLLVILAKSKVSLRFSFSRFKPLFRYGSKIVVASVLITVYADITNLIIGSRYTSEALAFYQKGTNFPKLLALSIITAINSSLFPIMAAMKDPDEIQKLVRKFNRISAFVITPMMFGFAAVSDTFVSVLLTDQWMPCSIYLKICCFSYAIQPLAMSSLQYLRASGRATEYLVLDIIRKVVGVFLIFLSLFLGYGVVGIAVAELCSQTVAILINMYPGKKHLEYTIKEQVFDVLPKFILSALMYLLVVLMESLPIPSALLLIAQILVGAGFYVLVSKLFRIKEFDELFNIAKRSLKKS